MLKRCRKQLSKSSDFTTATTQRQRVCIDMSEARTVRGAQQLFGNLTGWVREAGVLIRQALIVTRKLFCQHLSSCALQICRLQAQSAVADSFAGLAEEGVGLPGQKLSANVARGRSCLS